jgi:glycosyltransferase involved in cell wall biosynthesis
MKRINILQLVTGLGMGGAEKVVLDLAAHTDKSRFNTFVLAMSKRDELLNEFLENKIPTTILRKSNTLVDFIKILISVSRFVKENKIDIIHAHMAHAAVAASIVKLFHPSAKIVFTSHSFNIGSKMRELVLFCLKPFRDTDIIFSREIRKYFYKKNYQVIPNGVKLEKYTVPAAKNPRFTFIAVGRLERVKNHRLLIEIAHHLKDKFDFELQIAGEGYLRDELQEMIRTYQLEETVKLLGLRHDIPLLLGRSHCLLMPSLWEGLPIVILEGAASKIPIIAAPVGSIPSLLNEENAYLAGPEAFEEKMKTVLREYPDAQKKSQKLFEKIKSGYSIEAIVKAHEKIYQNLVKKFK